MVENRQETMAEQETLSGTEKVPSVLALGTFD